MRAERVVAKGGDSILKNEHDGTADSFEIICCGLFEIFTCVSTPTIDLSLGSDDRRGILGAQSSVARLGDLGGDLDA